MSDNSDREAPAETDRQPVRPKSPGLAREPEPESGDDAGAQEDFLPAD